MATFDEKYLASYKDAFMEVEGIDELENVLPSNKFPGYDELLVYLDAFVVNEIKAVNDCIVIVYCFCSPEGNRTPI